MNTKYLIELAQNLISIPTVAGREYLIENFLTKELSRLGCTIDYQYVPGTGGNNILASRGKGGPWFVTHVDVYPPYDHPNPFKPQIENDMLVGRGAVDTKGQIAALLWSLAYSSGPVQMAFVVDEENLGRGSEALIVPSKCQGAIVLEPTNLQIATAEAGSIGLEIIISGETAHGAMPWKGASAVEHAFGQYYRLLSQSFMSHHHPLFKKGGWVNLGKIRGGYDTMIVPNQCVLEIEIGFAPGISAYKVEKQVYEALNEAESIYITDIWEPWEADKETAIVQKIFNAFYITTGQTPKFWGMPSWTDGAHLFRKGVPTLIFGAGELNVAHTWREAVSIEQLETCGKVLRNLIQNQQY